jgi:hypothetical protein
MDLGHVACSLQHLQQEALVTCPSGIGNIHILQVFAYHLAALFMPAKVS